MPRLLTADERLAQNMAHHAMRIQEPPTLSAALALLRRYQLDGRPTTVTPRRCALMGYHQGYRFRIKSDRHAFSIPPDTADAYAIPQP